MARSTETCLLVATLLLAGCVPNLGMEEINKATKMCAAHGGVESVSTFVGENAAWCRDGAKGSFTKVRL